MYLQDITGAYESSSTHDLTIVLRNIIWCVKKTKTNKQYNFLHVQGHFLSSMRLIPGFWNGINK